MVLYTIIKYTFILAIVLFAGILCAVATIENCWKKENKSKEILNYSGDDF